MPKARKEVQMGESRHTDLVMFPNTDYPFVSRDLLSHSHKGLHKAMWMTQEKLASTSRGSKSILGEKHHF